MTRIQQKAKGKASPEVAGHPEQRIRIHLLPVDCTAECSQALPTPRQQGHVTLKQSEVIRGTADGHIQLPQVLPIGLRATGCCSIAAQRLRHVLQCRNQLLGTRHILQAKNQISLSDQRIGAPGEIEISTLRKGTKDLIALVEITGARSGTKQNTIHSPIIGSQQAALQQSKGFGQGTRPERQGALDCNDIDGIRPAAPRRISNPGRLLIVVKAKAGIKHEIAR